MNKRGQFYLLAAIIIVGIFIGIVALSNYSFKKSSTELNKIKEEMKIEGEKVLDYDKRNNDNKFEEFAKNYSAYVGENINIYFIVETSSSIEAYKYEGDNKIIIPHEVISNEVFLTVEGEEYSFDLKTGDDFYFIIIQEKEGEKHVVTN